MDKTDVQTLIHLINSQSEQTRKEIRNVESKLNKKISDVETKINFKIDQLEDKLEDKFENHRRKIVDEIQTFQDHVLADNKNIHQELTVNSARITRLEKHTLAN